MSSQFYDNGAIRTYRFPAVSFDTSAVFGRFIGPLGKRGRVRGIEGIITTATTDAAGEVTVDTNAGLTTPALATVPVAAADIGFVSTVAQLALGDDLPADTVIEVASDGGATVGDGDVTVAVEWF